jgi:hypothetical protein
MTRPGRKLARVVVRLVFGFGLPPRAKNNTPVMLYQFTKR